MPDQNQQASKTESQIEKSPASLPPNRSLAEVFGLGTVIFSYTRAQALEDGVLVDVSEMAKETGFRLPVAVTSALWADINDVPEGSSQDVTGRLWDVLWMGANAIQKAVAAGDTVPYQLILTLPGDSEEVLYTVKSVIGPGDDMEPVLTLMRPDED